LRMGLYCDGIYRDGVCLDNLRRLFGTAISNQLPSLRDKQFRKSPDVIVGDTDPHVS